MSGPNAKIEDREIEWSTKKIRLGDLKPYEHNPRFISVEQFNRLKDSIANKGYGNLIQINKDMVILAGHQRVKALHELGWKDNDLIEVRMPNYDMTEKEFREYLLESNFISGEFDYDVMANCFELEELIEVGFTEKMLGMGEDIELIDSSMEDALSDSTDGLDNEGQNKIIKIYVPDEEYASFQNQLDKLISKFPTVRKGDD